MHFPAGQSIAHLAALVCSRVAAKLLLSLVGVDLHTPHRQVGTLQLYWLAPTDILESKHTHLVMTVLPHTHVSGQYPSTVLASPG